MAAQKKDGPGEDPGGGEGEEGDGVAVGALGGGWGSGSVVAALGAALGLCARGGDKGEKREHEEPSPETLLEGVPQ